MSRRLNWSCAIAEHRSVLAGRGNDWTGLGWAGLDDWAGLDGMESNGVGSRGTGIGGLGSAGPGGVD